MILVTNDDGIFAPGMWALAKALQELDKVVVVAPDRERSAIGTAMTLRRPLRIRKAHPIMDGVEAYAVDGTPGDSVLLATSNLFEEEIDLVVSGINEGFNMGDDILISGTVGAALQGYLHNIPAMAISTAMTSESRLVATARLGLLLARRIRMGELPSDLLLNVNVPGIAPADIAGVSITRPAHKSHLDSAKEGSDGRQNYYWLVRHQIDANAADGTDLAAINQGRISLTFLHAALFGRPAPNIDDSFCQSLLGQLKNQL